MVVFVSGDVCEVFFFLSGLRNVFLLFFRINRVLRRRTEDTCAFFFLLRDVAARG